MRRACSEYASTHCSGVIAAANTGAKMTDKIRQDLNMGTPWSSGHLLDVAVFSTGEKSLSRGFVFRSEKIAVSMPHAPFNLLPVSGALGPSPVESTSGKCGARDQLIG